MFLNLIPTVLGAFTDLLNGSFLFLFFLDIGLHNIDSFFVKLISECFDGSKALAKELFFDDFIRISDFS